MMTDTLHPIAASETGNGQIPDELAALRQRIAALEAGAHQPQPAADALRESEHRFRIVFEHSPAAMLLCDPHHPKVLWPIVDCNAAACRLHGYTREELLGQSVQFLSTGQPTRDGCAALLERLRRASTIAAETVQRRKDGTRFSIELSTSLITVGGRELVLGIVHDLTARTQAEAERAQLAREQAARAAADVAQHRSAFLAQASMLLAASLEYETTLAQVAQLAVPALADWCVVDILAADGTVRPLAIAHSDPAQAAWGWALQQRYPTDVQAAYGVAAVLRTRQPELYADIPDRLLVALAQDAEHLDHLRRLGLTSAMIVPLIARGQLLGALSFGVASSGRRFDAADLALAVELAQRAALAIDNARLYQEAQAALQARDEFLALAAHELKTPLGTLFSSVRLLQDRGAQCAVRDPYAEELLGIARESAQHLAALVDALAAVAGLHSRAGQPAAAPVDLAGLARQVVAAVQRPLPAEQVELICPNEALLVRGDAVQLEHVLGNLLQNALKYSPPGGRVWVRVERRGDAACVVVRDAGIGIPAADLPHLFERFYRASNAGQHARSGLGLGLYFVKEVVTRHGGVVEVASVEGQGSTFTVRLPCAVVRRNA